ncbi:MAG: cation transporter [Bacteroidales bacterium]|jgi:Cu(I)/Ag(I) efflux system membrane fusion protein|nr:cation transporter [Bacteroidales bacterium]
MKRLILFFAVTVMIAAGNGCGNSGSQKKTPEIKKEEKSQKDEHAMLKASGSCEMCKTRIEKAAKDLDGVTVANWDRDIQQLHLHFDPKKTSVDAISKAIAKTGHDTEKDRADDVVYNVLPDCCKYRK